MADTFLGRQPGIAFLGYPAWGHTKPSLRLVSRLVARGWPVDYWSLEPFRAAVEQAGGRFRPYPSIAERLTAADGLAARLAAVARTAPALLAVIGAGLAHHRPALVIHDSLAVWGPSLAKRLAAPHAVSITTIATNRSMLRLLGADGLLPQDEWAAIGRWLARLDGGAFASPTELLLPRGDLKVVYTSREFQPGGPGFDGTHLFIGPMLDLGQQDGSTAPTRTYVSMGTLFNRNRAVFDACLAVFGRSGDPVLISLGGGLAPESFSNVPPNCEVVASCDQLAALRRARLFITHGGMNSVSEALAAGVPMILLPQDADQMVVARRVEALGCGIVLPPEAIMPSALGACISRIEPKRDEYVARCRAVAGGFPSRREQDAAIDVLLRLTQSAGPKDATHA